MHTCIQAHNTTLHYATLQYRIVRYFGDIQKFTKAFFTNQFAKAFFANMLLIGASSHYSTTKIFYYTVLYI